MKNDVSSMEWVTLDLTVPHEMADSLIDFCVEHGSSGVVLRDDDPDSTVLTAYFPNDHWHVVNTRLKEYLARLRVIFPNLPSPVAVVSPLANENWAVSWKEHFKSLPIGRHLIVTPPWLEPEAHGRRVIIIDPAEAFGTGIHETTQGCLVLLEEAVEEIKKTREIFTMLDMGCGSGILAIAGLKLGASEVRAVDSDPKAIASATRNAALNGVVDRLQLDCLSLEETVDSADILTANLDPLTILSNRDRLTSLFSYFLIVSGIPIDQWDHVKGELVTGKAVLFKEILRGEWGAGLFGLTSGSLP